MPTNVEVDPTVVWVTREGDKWRVQRQGHVDGLLMHGRYRTMDAMIAGVRLLDETGGTVHQRDVRIVSVLVRSLVQRVSDEAEQENTCPQCGIVGATYHEDLDGITACTWCDWVGADGRTGLAPPTVVLDPAAVPPAEHAAIDLTGVPERTQVPPPTEAEAGHVPPVEVDDDQDDDVWREPLTQRTPVARFVLPMTVSLWADLARAISSVGEEWGATAVIEGDGLVVLVPADDDGRTDQQRAHDERT